MKKEVEETVFEVENVEDFWSMCGDVICRQHEVHRSKLYIQEEATVSIPFRTR